MMVRLFYYLDVMDSKHRISLSIYNERQTPASGDEILVLDHPLLVTEKTI